jgi:hypothetical protein
VIATNCEAFNALIPDWWPDCIRPKWARRSRFQQQVDRLLKSHLGTTKVDEEEEEFTVEFLAAT